MPRVAVIGTGVIGASWAALCVARGCEVSAWDPADGAADRLHAHVEAFLPAIVSRPQGAGRTLGRIDWRSTPEEAVQDADFVQESGPEVLELKGRLFAALDRAAPTTTIIASSSSTLTASALQQRLDHPGRIVVGHPFNPPHLIPLVEVVGGTLTEPWALDAAMDFYSLIGKRPIRLRSEARGHVANRLQAALWQEALHLVQQGIAEVSDIDIAMTYGPGLRWACLGPLTGLIFRAAMAV